jgi:molybdopterin-synthase adenylyltransferase
MPDTARHARQIAFPAIGAEGQRRIGAGRIAVVGAGAVGAAVAEQLARSGVGRIKVIDRDVLEASNLGRQALYTTADAGARLPKAIALARHLAEIDPGIVIDPVVADLNASNVDSLLEGFDLVLDGTDNLDARYVLNDHAVARGSTWIYGGCVGSRGLTAVIIPGETPCLRCVYPEPPPPGDLETCETAGIIAPAANVIASFEVVEALKLLVGAKDRIRKSWICVELWPFRVTEIGGLDPKPRPNCPCCGRHDFSFLTTTRGTLAATLCGRDAVHVSPARTVDVDLDELSRRLQALGTVKRLEYVVVFTVGAHELTVFEDGRALVKGTADPGVARSLYHRYVGS